MSQPDPEVVAAVSARATARIAHHEAGHAVAAVAGGGQLGQVRLGFVDWSTLDDSADEPGETHHRSSLQNQPFVTFAGPWAEAMWTVENDPDEDDIEEALECAWIDSTDGDAATYEDRVDVLCNMAAQLGFNPIGRAWESAWADELEGLWPAVCEVAAMLIDGQPVVHDAVQAAIERSRYDDDSA